MRNFYSLKKRISICFVLLLSFLFVNNVISADYFWVGGTGNWSEFGTHWATSSGGAVFHTQIPTSNDNVYFDGNSFNAALQSVTLDVFGQCNNMSWLGVTNTPAFDGGNGLEIYGSIRLSPNMTMPLNTGLQFMSENPGNVIDFAGLSLNIWSLDFGGSGGEWTLLSDVDLSMTMGSINIWEGTLKTNGHKIDIQWFNGGGGMTASGLELGNSVLTISSMWMMQPFNFDAGTSEIHYKDTWFMGGYEFYDFFFEPDFPSDIQIMGDNTFNNVSFNSNVTSITLDDETTQTFNNISVISDCVNRLVISAWTNAYLFKTAGNIDIDNIAVKNITVLGGVNITSENSIDLGNVHNWTINTQTPKAMYWVGGTGDWNDPNHWALTSGGVADSTCVPTIVDTVIFDVNSFLTPGRLVTINGNAYCKSINWTGVVNNPSFEGWSPLYIGGSLTYDNNMGNNFSGEINFISNNANNTITLDGEQLQSTVYFDGDGSWEIQDNFSVTSTIYLRKGSLITNDNDVNASSFYIETNATKELTLGSSTIIINGDWRANNTENLTFDAGSSTISPSGGTFNGGDLVYNDVIFTNNTNVYIDGENTFQDLIFNSGINLYLEEGKTQIVDTISLSGDCVDFAGLFSQMAGQQAMILSPSGTIDMEFIRIKDIDASGGAVFNAINSTDQGNVTGLNISGGLSQTFYWIGNSGNWNDPGHWSLTSGGAAGSCIPTELDSVIFDDNSFSANGQTININIEAFCNTLIYNTGWREQFSGSNTLNIYGSLYLSLFAGVTNYTGSIYFKSDVAGNTITLTGQTLYSNVYLDGQGEWTLQSNIDFKTTGGWPYKSLYIEEGTLNTNDNDISAYMFASNTSKNRVLNLGSSTITLTSYWNIADGSNMLINPGTSLITQSSSSFYGGGLIYNDVTLTTTGSVYLYGSNTFNTLDLSSSSVQLILEGGTTQTYSTLLIPDGTGCDDFMLLLSSNIGQPAALSKAAGSQDVDFYKITDVTAGGGATFNATNTITQGDVTGWTIVPYTGQDYYWIGGTGNWNDVSHWSLSSGGPATTCLPTEADNVIFDTASFSAPDQIVTINTNAYCKDMVWTTVTDMPTLDGWSSLYINGSLTFTPNMIVDFGSSIYFTSDMAGQTIDLAGHFLNQFYIKCSGEYNLQDDIDMSPWGTIILESGTLNTNDNTIIASFSSWSDAPRTLNLGSSDIDVYDWMFDDSTNLTINAGTSHISMTGQGNNFYGGYQTYNDVTIVPPPPMWGPVWFYGSNTFNTLEILPGTEIVFESNVVQTTSNLIALGESGNLIHLHTQNVGTRATISQTGTDYCGNFLKLQDMEATGGATFFAGGSSEDDGNNIGWTFNDLEANDQYPFDCEDTQGSGTIAGQDLTAMENAITGGFANPVSWFSDIALTIPVGDPSNITAGDGDIYYAEVSGGTCTNVAEVLFTVFPIPVANDQTPELCEESFGLGMVFGVDLTALESAIDGGAGATISWYEEVGLITLVADPTDVTVITGTDFFAEVDDGNCVNVAAVTYTVNGLPTTNDQTPEVCEDLLGGGTTSGVNLTLLDAAVDGGTGTTITWYEDAGLSSAVPDPTNVVVSDADDFYAEVDNGSCIDTAIITYTVNGIPVANNQTPEYCEDTEGSGSTASIDLTALNAAIDGGAGNTVTWYEDAGLSVAVATPASVTVNDADDFYAEVDDGTCTNIATVTYTIQSLPEANDLTPALCEDSPGSGVASGADLTSTESLINSGGAAITWYEDAGLSVPVATPANITINDADDFYAEVDDGTCLNVATVVYSVSGTINAYDQTVELCEDSPGSGAVLAVNLRDRDAAINGGSGAPVSWYEDSGLLTAVPDPTDVDITTADTFYVEIIAGTCGDSAIVIYNINALPVINNVTPEVCEDTIGTGNAYGVDLTANNSTIDGGAGYTILWYEDIGLTTLVTDPTDAMVSNAQVLYAEADNGNCKLVATATYTVNSLPVANDQLPAALCEDIYGGGQVAGIDLSALEAAIDGGAGSDIAWFTDVALTIPVVDSTNVTVVNASMFYVRVENANCSNIASVEYVVNSMPSSNNLTSDVCEDSPGSGTASNYDLTQYESAINSSGGLTFTWYTDAALTSPVPLAISATVNDGDTLYVDVNNGNCSDTASLILNVGNVITANNLDLDICETVIGSNTTTGYDLTQHNNEITGGSPAMVVWYTDAALTTPVADDSDAILVGLDTLYVSVVSGSCNNTAEIIYEVQVIPNFSLGSDATIAPTATLILDPGSTYSAYVWSTGDTTDNITVDANVLGLGTYTYSLSVTNAFGCEGADTIVVTVAIIDNINTENSNSLVEIYPNPASSVVTINAPLNTSISIIDIYGRVMTSWENSTLSKVLNVTKYSSGLYFIKISEQDNTETLKLIIE